MTGVASQSVDSGNEHAFLNVSDSVTGRLWLPRLKNDRAALLLSQRLGAPEIIGRILAARGVELSDADAALNPSLRNSLPDPSVFMDMNAAAARLSRAVQTGEQIAIFGDYDVDGATSSAVLSRMLRAVEGQVRIYIPDRIVEGYGPNAKALLGLGKEGASLIVTVDCGTLSYEPLAQAADAGLDVIVVDHHQAEPKLPHATALINPNRLDDHSGHGQLAAVGVAFMLAVAVNRELRQAGWFEDGGRVEPDLLSLLDLVALGTVCDVVPLTGLNRALLAQGLKVMKQRRNVGLAALMDVAEIDTAPGTYELGFLLGPRVNAGGRVGRSDLGARLLTTENAAEAAEIAAELDLFNQERKVIEAGVQEAALAKLDFLISGGAPPPLVLVAEKGWHQGVIGIVAGRLKERASRPAIVIAIDKNGIGKGSGRSVPGVDLGAAVVAAHQAGLLLSGGGHAMAAGLTVEAGRIDELEAFLTDRIARALVDAPSMRALKIDGAITPGAASGGLMELVEQAGPFGAGYPEPVFALAAVRIAYADRVGESHVRCRLAGDDGAPLSAIAFRCLESGLGEALLEARGGRLHIAGKLRRDKWRGGDAVQLIIEDAAPVVD